MKPTLKEKCNDILRHLTSTGALKFRDCKPLAPECAKKYKEWEEALLKAERMIEELPDG